MTLLKYKQASEVLGISKRTLRRRVNQGQIACIKMGKLVRFKQEDIEDYIKSKRLPAFQQPKKAS